MHRLTAVLEDAAGNNLLIPVLSIINVEKNEDASGEDGKTTVTFRLIGDKKHGASEEGHAYTTWIRTTSYTFDSEEVTAGEVFKRALEEAGLKHVGLENNYVRTVYAPEVCGGYPLSEKENGLYSGWMYTVNGKHPGAGLNSWYVYSGDEIIFHYVDNYLTEQADRTGGAGGNASTWNKWLEAPDITPGALDNARAVEERIGAIGEVTPERLKDDKEQVAVNEAIQEAREAYDQLTEEEKGLVKTYETLLAAERDYVKYSEEKADHKAAQAVIDLILAADHTVTELENKQAAGIADLWEADEEETEPGLGTEMETGPETETESDTEEETGSKAETGPITESEVETGPEIESESETETETESKAETEPETETETKPETKSEPEAETGTETKRETGPETEPETKSETGAETGPETERETETGTEPEIKAETQTETKTETGIETETERKTEAGTTAEAGTTTEAEVKNMPPTQTEATQTEASADPESGALEIRPVDAQTVRASGRMSGTAAQPTAAGAAALLQTAGNSAVRTADVNGTDSDLQAAFDVVIKAREAYEGLTPGQKKLVQAEMVYEQQTDGTETITDKNFYELQCGTEIRMALLLGPESVARAAQMIREAEEAVAAIEHAKELSELKNNEAVQVETAYAWYEAVMAVWSNEDTAGALGDKTLADYDVEEALVNRMEEAVKKAADMAEAGYDQERADGVSARIAGLPKVEDLTLTDEADITAARNAYDDLTETQKALVEGYDSLTALEAALNTRKEEAEAVAEQISTLADAELTLDRKAEVEAARAAYNNLADDQKRLLSVENEQGESVYGKLLRLEADLAALEAEKAGADSVAQMVKILAGLREQNKLTLRHKSNVESARNAYDQLTEKQKAMIPGTGEQLERLEERIRELEQENPVDEKDLAEAKKAADLIEALPTPDKLTLDKKEAVENARKAYDALSDGQKALIPSDLLTKLQLLEAKLKDLESQGNNGNNNQGGSGNQGDNNNPGGNGNQGSNNQGGNGNQGSNNQGGNGNQGSNNPEGNGNQGSNNPGGNGNQGNNNNQGNTGSDEITLTYSNYPVTIRGKGLEGCELVLKPLTASDGSVKKMQEEISAKEALIRLYDISLYKNGKEIQPPDTVTLNFQVGTKYNGDTLTVLHVDGSRVISHRGKVSGGVLSIEVDSLSAFGVVVDTSTVTLSDGNGNNNGTSTTNGQTTLTCGNYPVSVTGKGIAGYTLKVEALTAENEDVKRMQAEISSDRALIRLYDISLYNGDSKVTTFSQPVSVNFQVGTKYNGETLTILHVVDGKVQRLSGIVSGGVVSVKVDSLSPFGVVVDASGVTDDNTLTKTANGTNTTGGTAASASGARTGDTEDPLLQIMAMMAAAGMFAGLVFYRKKKTAD